MPGPAGAVRLIVGGLGEARVRWLLVRRLLVRRLGPRRLVVVGLRGTRDGLMQGILRPAPLFGLVVSEAALTSRVLRSGRHVGRVRRVRVPADGAERLTLGAFNLCGIGAPAALQIEVFSYRIVKKTHAPQPTRR